MDLDRKFMGEELGERDYNPCLNCWQREQGDCTGLRQEKPADCSWES